VTRTRVVWLLEDSKGQLSWDEWPVETRREAQELARRRLADGGCPEKAVKFIRAEIRK